MCLPILNPVHFFIPEYEYHIVFILKFKYPKSLRLIFFTQDKQAHFCTMPSGMEAAQVSIKSHHVMKSLLIVLPLMLLGLTPFDGLTAADCELAKRLIEQGTKEKLLKKRLALYQQAVSACPDADAPHFYYGLALEEQEDNRKQLADYSLAVNEYRKVLSINPQHTGAIFKLAGIAYVTHRFDSAIVYYEQFLAMEKPSDANINLLHSAGHLLAKSKWLALLPADALEKGALTNDPDRLAGLSSLLGNVAFELGNAAMQVTGQVGYGLAGAGAKIGMKLLTDSEINIGRVRRYFESGSHDFAFWEARGLLPKAINKKGINSQEVFVLLVYINRCASRMPGLLEEAAPYCGGVPAMQHAYLQLQPIGMSNRYMYSNLSDFTSAWERLGDDCQRRNRHGEAVQYFRRARDLHRQLGGVHKAGERIPDADGPEVKMEAFHLEMQVAKAECYMDSTHSLALHTLESAFEQLQKEPGWDKQTTLWAEYHQALETWGIFSGSHPSCSIDDFLRYKALVERYPAERSADVFLLGLNNCLSVLEHSWGEYNAALQHMSARPDAIEAASSAGILLDYRSAVLYNSVFMLDSAGAVLQHMAPNALWYKERIALARRLLMTGKTNEGMDILVACRELEKKDTDIRNADLMPATTVLWMVLEAATPEGNAKLEELRAHWKMIGELSPDRFPAIAPNLLRLTAFSEGHSAQKKLLYDHLDAICRQIEHHRQEDLNALRLQYFIAAQQWERALELCLQMEKIEAVAPQNDRSFDVLQQPNKARLAMLYHETKRYKEAIDLRRSLLQQLLPFEQALPENVADCKVRLAESLAAAGQKDEARRLLEEAVACYDRLSPLCQTLHHQRARDALGMLRRGKADIACHGKMIFEFSR
ncbi:MAG: hypothetical protein SFV52_08155 [Saprospiraceae bacterium]|nr:hypothetical protein [Saprospiraceae bacterium]